MAKDDTQVPTCDECKRIGAGPRFSKAEPFPCVQYAPGYFLTQQPMVSRLALDAELIADTTWAHGPEYTQEAYALGKTELLVVCWWAGLFGPRRYRRRWGAWAERANPHLWHGCINVTVPPWKGEA